MDIVKFTNVYEHWMGGHFPIFQQHLDQKHLNMASSRWLFFRGTDYNYLRLVPKVLPKRLLRMRRILLNKDLHIENFGLFVDLEDRPNWWCNDYDEADFGAWPEDLIRLATSVDVASDEEAIRIKLSEACDSILTGFEKGLVKGPQPFVLGSRHSKLNRMAFSKARDPKLWWRKTLDLPVVEAPVEVHDVLRRALPPEITEYSIRTRMAGEGSLGRPRYVAIAMLHGDYIARECKSLLPSAQAFVNRIEKPDNYYNALIHQAPRRDPYLHIDGNWIVRRIGPHNSRIELAQLRAAKDQSVVLKSMGRETCNMDIPNMQVAEEVRAEFLRLPSTWLERAAKLMTEANAEEQAKWAKRYYATH
jgi:hypothetical protein